MIAVGENFSHFEIIAPIGAGGMGEVYLARDHYLERNVALKFVAARPGDDPERAKRFTREAKAASALNHPNILTIYEIGETNGTRYIASEFIDGVSLRGLIRSKGPLALETTLDIAMQVLSALSTAHSAGIIHRDIKPENIMVREDGVVKVLDFGLVKLAEPELNSGSEDVTKQILTTSPGMVMGTPQYMSPEQARGKRVDPRTDIWSIGVVIYEMLAGVPPFQGESSSDVFAAILKTEARPLSLYRPEVPPDLEFIIKKALGKNAEERYQTVKDLLLDLKRVKREFESGSVSAESFPSSDAGTRQMAVATQRITQTGLAGSGWKWVVAAGILIIAVATAGYLWIQSRTDQTGSLTGLSSAQITSWKSELTDNDPSRARLSPDGKLVAYVASKNGKKTIWLKQIGGGEPFTRKQDDESEETSPLWSPDGQNIAFLSERGGQRGIWQMPAFGGSPVLLAPIDGRSQHLVHWSRDGDRIYFDMKQNLYSLELTGKSIAKLTNFDEAVLIDRGFSVSPDEKQIVFADRRDGRKDIWISALDGQNATRLVDDAANDSNPVWHPDGKRVIYNSERDGLQQICVAHADGRTPVQLTFSDSDSTISDVSMDGTRILYTQTKDDSDIWSISLEGGKEAQRTSDVGIEYWADASPVDGSIAFQAVRRSSLGNKLLHSAVETIKPDGRQVDIVEDGFAPKYSPDGRYISFLRGDAGNNSLWIASTAGGDARALTAGGVTFAGHTVLPFNRAQFQDYQWAPDSSSIVYCAVRDGVSNVWRVTIAGEEIRLTSNQNKALMYFGPIVASDGTRVIWTGRSAEDPRKVEWGIWQILNGAENQVFRSDSEIGLVGWNESQNGFVVKVIDASVPALPTPSDVRLLEVDLDGGQPQEINRLKNAYFRNVVASPDHKTIAFVSRTDGDSVQVGPISGGSRRTLASSRDPRVYFSNLAFAPDGRTLYYGKQAKWRIISILSNFK